MVKVHRSQQSKYRITVHHLKILFVRLYYKFTIIITRILIVVLQNYADEFAN